MNSLHPPLPPGPLARAWGARATAAQLDLAGGSAGLAMPTISDRDVWAPLADSETVSCLLAAAETERGTPWPTVPARGYARYARDGDRIEHEDRLTSRAHRLTRAVIAALVTGADSWVDEAADGILAMCEQSSWCWPAHDDAYARGFHLPDVTRPFLDLGAGEVAAQLAWCDVVLGPALDARMPGLRERIRHETTQRVFTPFTTRDDWHWLGADGRVHNWNPWIHQNVLTAAIALDSGDTGDARTATIVERALAGLDIYLSALPADGAIDEGFDYWWNGACRALEALDIVARATGGRLNIAQVAGVRATVDFPAAMWLGGEFSYSFSDACARINPHLPWHLLGRWGRAVGSASAVEFARRWRPVAGPVATVDEGLGRLLLALTDPEWMTAPAAEPGRSGPAGPRPGNSFFASTEVFVAHAGQFTLAAKGGHNGENHNHLDVGSVSVAHRGRPILVDAGRQTYTAVTFGPERYSLWNNQTAWHNVPRIGGRDQLLGDAAAARVLTAELGTARSTFGLDLAGAYGLAGTAPSWRREATVEAGGVRVSDVWSALPPGGPQEITWLIAGQVRRSGPRSLADSTGVVLEWSPGLEADLVVRELHDPYQRSAWGQQLTRLTLRAPATASGSAWLQVRFEHGT